VLGPPGVRDSLLTTHGGLGGVFVIGDRGGVRKGGGVEGVIIGLGGGGGGDFG
jgi:hypothetical protein